MSQQGAWFGFVFIHCAGRLVCPFTPVTAALGTFFITSRTTYSSSIFSVLFLLESLLSKHWTSWTRFSPFPSNCFCSAFWEVSSISSKFSTTYLISAVLFLTSENSLKYPLPVPQTQYFLSSLRGYAFWRGLCFLQVAFVCFDFCLMSCLLTFRCGIPWKIFLRRPLQDDLAS